MTRVRGHKYVRRYRRKKDTRAPFFAEGLALPPASALITSLQFHRIIRQLYFSYLGFIRKSLRAELSLNGTIIHAHAHSTITKHIVRITSSLCFTKNFNIPLDNIFTKGRYIRGSLQRLPFAIYFLEKNSATVGVLEVMENNNSAGITAKNIRQSLPLFKTVQFY